MISATPAGASAKPRSQTRRGKGSALDGPQLFTIPSLSVRRWKSSSARSSWLSSALWEIAPSWWMSHRSSGSTASKSSASTPLSRRPSPSSPTSPPPPAPPFGPRPSTLSSCRRPGRETSCIFFSFCRAAWLLACRGGTCVCLFPVTWRPLLHPAFHSLQSQWSVRGKPVYYGYASVIAKVTSALAQPASREWQCPLAARLLTLVCTADQCAEVSQKPQTRVSYQTGLDVLNCCCDSWPKWDLYVLPYLLPATVHIQTLVAFTVLW